MAVVKVHISDETEQQFRKAAMQKYGYKKGSLSEAAESALSEWSVHQGMFSKEMRDIKNPVAEMKGMLKHVKKTSVQLQHEIGQREIVERQIKLMKKGFHMGNAGDWKREELYER